MISSLRAALIALSSLALTPLIYAAEPVVAAPEETAATERKIPIEVPLEQAAGGVEAAPAAAKETPAKVQLPFDLKAAADIALAAFGGEVLKAEQVVDATGTRFNIRVINNGRVRDVVIDAANGEIIKPLDVEAVPEESSDNEARDSALQVNDAEAGTTKDAKEAVAK